MESGIAIGQRCTEHRGASVACLCGSPATHRMVGLNPSSGEWLYLCAEHKDVVESTLVEQHAARVNCDLCGYDKAGDYQYAGDDDDRVLRLCNFCTTFCGVKMVQNGVLRFADYLPDSDIREADDLGVHARMFAEQYLDFRQPDVDYASLVITQIEPQGEDRPWPRVRVLDI